MTRNFIHSLNDGTDWRTDGHTKGSRIGFFFATLITFYGKFEKFIDLNKKCLQSKEERKKNPNI